MSKVHWCRVTEAIAFFIMKKFCYISVSLLYICLPGTELHMFAEEIHSSTKKGKTRLGLQCQTPLEVLTRLDSKVFSLKRLYPSSLIEVSKSKILGPKKIWVWQNFWSKKIFGFKTFLGPNKIFCSKINFVKKIFFF